MSSRVFVPQIPCRRDQSALVWIPMIDISPAKDFGEIVEIIPPGGHLLQTKEIMKLMTRHLSMITDDDCIAAVGSPFNIALAATIAARNNDGFLRMLEWDSRERAYKLKEVEVY